MMKTSSKGIKLITSFEGCRLKAYDDAQPNIKLTEHTVIKGTLTIGYGHTGVVDAEPIKWNTKITKKKAVELLKSDLHRFETCVAKYERYHWSQNEFDALVDFAYNHGTIDDLTVSGARSKKVIAEKMLLYINKGTIFEAGLTRRRTEDRKLFLTK